MFSTVADPYPDSANTSNAASSSSRRVRSRFRSRSDSGAGRSSAFALPATEELPLCTSPRVVATLPATGLGGLQLVEGGGEPVRQQVHVLFLEHQRRADLQDVVVHA